MSKATKERYAFLRRIPLFAQCSDKDLAKVDAAVDDVNVDAGETVVKEGRSGYEAFLIVEGQADVSVGGDKIASLGDGDLFGEMAVLDGDSRRKATVTATTPMKLLVIEPQRMQALLDIPGVGEQVRELLNKRHAEIDPA